MKLKLDDAGHAVLQDGKPVYVHEDGKEVAFDAPATVSTISRLNGEAKGHREAKEAAEAKLKAFEGIEDPAAAKKALETVKNIDDKKLVDAGKVEEIKEAAVKAYKDQAAAAAKAHAEEVNRVTGERDQILSRYNTEKIGGAFKGSQLIADKFAIPADFVEAKFGSAFKVEDGKIVAYGPDGNKIYSRERPGDLANFDEALQSLVDQYPQRDQILKGTGGGGSGKRQDNGAGPGVKQMTRAEYDAMSPAVAAAKFAEGYTVRD
jgi:hypothetical protein